MRHPFQRSLTVLGTLILLAALSRGVPAASAARPNVLILVADDLGWADVGFHGGDIPTPNLDRLAADGVELARHYTCPVCSPTRAGLMTGRYPDRYGMRDGVIAPNRMHGLPPHEETLAELFAVAGYPDRAMIGKWHLGHSHVKYHPLNQGFTSFYGHYNGAIDYFLHIRDGQSDWHRNFSPIQEKGYSTDLMADEAVRFLQARNPGSPFFLYVAFNAPHSPMQGRFNDMLARGYDPDKPIFTEGTGGSRPGEKGLERYGKIGNGNSVRQTYEAMVMGLDDGIGKILRALDRTGQTANTLLLFMSDNGGVSKFGGGNLPRRGEKHTVFEGGVCVNTLVRWPARGWHGGRRLESLTAYIDWMPTLRSVLEVTETPAMPLDGIDLTPVLDGRSPGPDRTLWLGHDAVVSTQWKWVEGALYRIDQDRNETTDLSGQEPTEAQRLQDQVAAFRSIAVDPIDQGKFETPSQWVMPGSLPSGRVGD